MPEIDIIQSKLTAPVPVEAITRPRLVELMEKIPAHRLTVVSAGAGYGKSTLIAQACQHLSLQHLWYKLEKSDCDFIAFVHYLIAGFQRYHPGFGTSVIACINNNYFNDCGILSISEKGQPSILARLIKEMEQAIDAQTVVVLDDFHELGDRKDIRSAVLYLVEHLPPNIHLVIVSRTDPEIPLSRYRAAQQVLDIGKTELVFDASESDALFQSIFHMNLSESRLKALHQKTEGWVTGLILFYHYAKEKTAAEIDDLLSQTGGNNRIIADYMQENVWAGQPKTVQRFLMETSIFSVIEADMAGTLLNRDDARSILKSLEAQHLFTFSMDDAGVCYCYHQLFQKFLQNKLILEMGKPYFQRLHQKTARYYEDARNHEKALVHFLEAEDYENFFRLLGPVGKTLVQKGRFRHLDAILEKVPSPYDKQEPWVLYYQASTFFAAGQFQEVVHLAQQAYEGFVARYELDGARLCLMDMGQAHYWLGNFFEGEMIFKELLQCPPLSPEVEIKTLGHLVLTSAWYGDMEASDQYYERLEHILASQKTTDEFRILKAWADVCHGFRYQFAGAFAQSVEKGKQALNAIGNLETGQSLAFCYQLLGISYFFLGEFDKSIDVNTKGLQLVAKKGFLIYEAWYLSCLALTDLHSDRYEDARQKATHAFDVFNRFGSKWGKAFSILALLPLNMKIGNKKDIEAIILNAISIAGDIHFAWFEGKSYYFFAIDQMRNGALKASQASIDRAKSVSSFNAHDVCLNSFVQACLFLKQGNQETAIALFMNALKKFEQNGYGLWVIRFHAEWMMPLLVRAYETGKMRSYLQRVFSEIGQKAIPLLTEMQQNNQNSLRDVASDILANVFKVGSSNLEIYCLGRFRVYVEGREVSDAEWKSKKARQLFKYLAVQRNKDVIPREALLAFLWPGQDSKKTIKRLRVAITMLRRTLEPDIQQWARSTFLERKNGGYKLNLGANGFVDVDAFESKLQQAGTMDAADAKRDALLEALAIYSGDFLEEALYEDWTVAERERLRTMYLDAVKSVADLYAKAGDYQKSIFYARLYLDKDNTAEDVFQRLMQYYAEIGDKAMIVKTYQKCQKHIADRFACLLSDNTINLYHHLVGREQPQHKIPNR